MERGGRGRPGTEPRPFHTASPAIPWLVASLRCRRRFVGQAKHTPVMEQWQGIVENLDYIAKWPGT